MIGKDISRLSHEIAARTPLCSLPYTPAAAVPAPTAVPSPTAAPAAPPAPPTPRPGPAPPSGTRRSRPPAR
ncbi:hypothetical protein FGW37_26910 [Streptomyces rectiverticillatus]|nr:hypothetical protein FGW37_26910 [Streptomyces rectiverticillatus]